VSHAHGGTLYLTPEAIIAYFFKTQIGPQNIVDSCHLTGPLLINNRHKVLHRPCAAWTGDVQESQFDDFAAKMKEYKMYFEEADIDRRILPLIHIRKKNGF